MNNSDNLEEIEEIDSDMKSIFFELYLGKIRNILPFQNPLNLYIHNNPLTFWEEGYFFKALERAAELYKAFPYRRLEKYDQIFQKNKIDMSALIEAQSNEKLRCEEGKDTTEYIYAPLRNHLYWENVHGIMMTFSIHDFLIPIVCNFYDMGFTKWENPFKSDGFLKFFFYYCENSYFYKDWMKCLLGKVKEYKNSSTHKIIMNEFAKTGLDASDFEKYIEEICFDLRGWAGMISKIELEKELFHEVIHNVKLSDFIAVRVLCENAMNESLCEKLGLTIGEVLEQKTKDTFNYSSYRLMHELDEIIYRNNTTKKFKNYYKNRKKQEEDLIKNKPTDVLKNEEENLNSENFDKKKSSLKDSINLSKDKNGITDEMIAFFCMDDREAALRAHLYKINPKIKTFGVLGSFGLDMYYKGPDNYYKTSNCPPVVKPNKLVTEQNEFKTKFGSVLYYAQRLFYNIYIKTFYYSISLIGGFLSSWIFGFYNFVVLTSRAMFPDVYFFVYRFFRKFRSKIVRTIDCSSYTVQEKAKIVSSIFNHIGLKKIDSKLVFAVAHENESANNFFNKAYGCGACRGNSGFINAKVYCEMANDLRVRQELSKNGYEISEKTLFLPACHNTTSDELVWLPNNLVNISEYKELITKFKIQLQAACESNLVDRSKYFDDIFNLYLPGALKRSIQNRSLDLSQIRPEWGHSKANLIYVGSDETFLNIEFDRRAFAVSYYNKADESGAVLCELAGLTVPVGVNIAYDYYFSHLDERGFGSGNKLPLNPVSLIGVMTGSLGDLNVGLPSQMTEIHEILRPILFIEADLNKIELLMNKNTRIRNLILNRWLLVVRIEPESHEMYFYSENHQWNGL